MPASQCPCMVGAAGPQYPSERDPTRCKRFRCSQCKQWRPWCEGGAPDDRCNYCVCAPERRPN